MGTLSSPAPHAPPPAADSAPVLSAVNRFFETSLFLLLLTGVLTVIGTGKLDPVSSLVALTILMVKGWRWRRHLPAELSESTARRLTIGYLLFFPIDFFFISMALAEGSQSVPLFAALLAVIHLLLFTMLVRLYSARTTRDYMFLAMVAFALVLVSAILTIDTAFLAFLVTFLLLCISTFMGLEMRRSAEGAASPPLATGTPAARRLNRALGLTTAGLSIGALVLGGFIFLLLPRVTAGFLSSYNFQPTLLTGFDDDETRLGQIGTIKQSPAVVMRVKPLRGQIGMEYWRGSAFTNFDGVAWTTPPHPTRRAERYDRDMDAWYQIWWEGADTGPFSREGYRKLMELRQRLKAYPREVTYRVFLEPIGSDKIFMATQGAGLRGTFAPGSDPMGLRRGSSLHVDMTHSVSNAARNFSRLIYDVRSVKRAQPAELLREAGTEITPEIRRWYLQLPENLDPRIKQLAEQITASEKTQYDKVAAIERYLRTEFMYSLELTGASLPDFLFKTKTGHCEYFASAMAVMLRTIDIPTRYARGFLGGEYNDVGNDWIVRARDAHSWVEVYFPEIGWATFDPTPPAPAGLRGFLHRLSLYWDAAELLWIDWVVNYNFQQQAALGSNVRRETARWNQRLYQWARGIYDEAVVAVGRFRRQLMNMAHEAPGSMAALLLSAVLGVLYLWKRRALLEWLAVRYGVRLGRSQETQLVTLYYQQILGLLAKRGAQKSPGQTPREFAAALGASPQTAPLAPTVQAATVIFEEARYGAAPPNLPELARLLDALRSLPRTP